MWYILFTFISTMKMYLDVRSWLLCHVAVAGCEGLPMTSNAAIDFQNGTMFMINFAYFILSSSGGVRPDNVRCAYHVGVHINLDEN